jgi:regulatory protein YycI of two-component signal transduction system YycFG
MNFEEFISNLIIFMIILGLVLFIISLAVKKRKPDNHNNNLNNCSLDYSDNTISTHGSLYKCSVCGYASYNDTDFDDGACIMCDAI